MWIQDTKLKDKKIFVPSSCHGSFLNQETLFYLILH